MGLDRREFLGGLVGLAVGGRPLLAVLGGEEGMYGLIGSIEAVEGRRDELIRILLEGTRSMPGCLSYVVATDVADATTVWVTEVWESREAHEAALSLPAVRQAIADARPLMAGFGSRTVTTPSGGHGLERSPVSADGTRDPVAPVEDRVVALSALLGVPPAEAFAHFVDPGRLTVWLTPLAAVEPVVGGRYELFWEPEVPENNSTIGCRITALVPGQLLAFQWRSPEQFRAFANTADPLTHVVVTFLPEGAGTRVHLVHSGWRSNGAWEEARLWQERAWRLALRKLEQVAGRAGDGGP
jgi:quinol monooxygenase YgiN/uncharacterized protein YndB with AHSA1/START domain